MSLACASRRNTARPIAAFRSRTMLRLPRLTALNAGVSLPTAPGICRVESPDGGSTLITSAPRSASSIAVKGPAITCVVSSTRRPSSARKAEGCVSTIFVVEGPLAILTFNRPQARNAMTWEMYDALAAACDRVDADDSVRVLILRGAGGAFVAGTDIAQFRTFRTPQDGLDYERRLDATLDRLERLTKPAIAQIHGGAAGGGAGDRAGCGRRT